MSIIKRHVQKHSRHFQGEREAFVLLRLLNGEMRIEGVPDPKALLTLIRNLQALESCLQDEANWTVRVNAKAGKVKPSSEVSRRFRAVNKDLSGYVSVPFIWPDWLDDPDTLSRGWQVLWANPKSLQPFMEMKMVQNALELARLGQISSIRQCKNCSRWIFARFENQRFCSARCRERHFQSSPMERKKRRKAARDNYWLHKNKNIK